MFYTDWFDPYEVYELHNKTKVTDDYFKCGDYTMEYFEKCFEAVAVWAVGGTGLQMPEHVGYPVGHHYGESWGLMEVHFDNNQGAFPEKPIRAGLRLQFAKENRPIEAGLISTGLNDY